MTVQFTNNSSFCWLNAAITATCWALKSLGVLNPIRGPLPKPKDGILAALLAWSQLEKTTIVNSYKFFPLYLAVSGGANAISRTGNQYADQFFQDVLPDPPTRTGIPELSKYMHPYVWISTKNGNCSNCNCRNIFSEKKEKLAVLNLAFPRISLAQSLLEKFGKPQIQVIRQCPNCGHKGHTITTTTTITEASQIFVISIERIEHKTRHIINNLVTIQEVSTNHDISLPLKDGGHVNYTLVAAIIPKQNHFVALLKSSEGLFIEVNDDMKPIIVGPEEIGKAEIFIFRRINREIPVFYE